MVALMELLLIFLCLGAATSEVGDNFNKCSKYFYRSTPPTILHRESLEGESICQVYGSDYHFATLYSKRWRIPIYSAYILPSGSCRGDQPNRRNTWFIEPQLLSRGESRDMNTAGTRKNEYKGKQALNEDYRNTGFDRGHLNPNFYHCDASRTATFTLTNAVPQDACFNEQIWHALESRSKTIMDELCPVGATRFFVTGTIPHRRRIPNEEHDVEEDSTARDYNRVSVPSHMWTAVCCDNAGDRSKSFSFGYIGENKADGVVETSSVRQLEISISSIPPTGSQSIIIFADGDKCNENSENSKNALVRITAVVVKDTENSLDKLSKTDQSELPFKKRKLDSSQIQSVEALGKNVLFDFTLGVQLRNTSTVINTFRDSLKSSSDITVIMSGFNHIKQKTQTELDAKTRRSRGSFNKIQNNLVLTRGKPETDRGHSKNRPLRETRELLKIISPVKFGNPYISKLEHSQGKPPQKVRPSSDKKSAEVSTRFSKFQEYMAADEPEVNVDGYLFAAELSAANVTINGDYCRSGHGCDFHDKKYRWCYIDKANNWDYCCLNDCKSANWKTSIPKCDVGKEYKGYKCSMRSSVITVNGGRCRYNHECGLHQLSYYWCYTDFNDNWEYCCQPWHRCDYYDKSASKWCYAGKEMKTTSRNCFY